MMIKKATLALLVPCAVAAQARHPLPGEEGSPNIHVMSHIPMGGYLHTTDIDIEQELARPYAYISRGVYPPSGFDIISVKDIGKERAHSIYSWNIENADQHKGPGALRGRYFKAHGRYYFVQAFQFTHDSPDADLGAILFDVTSLPDTTKIKEVARIRVPDAPGGFHSIFPYKHSDGRVLLFASTSAKPYAQIFDLDKLLAGAANQGLVGQIANPSGVLQGNTNVESGFNDFWAGYDPAAHQDKFYGAGNGGYYVFDITRPEEPKLLTSMIGVMGVLAGGAITPTPDGHYAVTTTAYQFAPIRIFDLQPGLSGQLQTISEPVGAWTADWHDQPHNPEVRWPYVFVGSYEDGLQVFDMMDPKDPYTIAYYRTYPGPHQAGCCSTAYLTDPSADPRDGGTANGAWGVQVRNVDGLIVVSDMTTGFWAFYLDGFQGWNGRKWGKPNASTAQNWDSGPEGASPHPATAPTVQ